MSQAFFFLSLSFITSLFFVFSLIKFFSAKDIRQVEREEGLDSHKVKSGTPTMGGLGFVIAISIISVVFIKELLPLVLLFLSYSLIGFFDDFLKVVNRRNMGLTSRQKLLLQIIFAFLFLSFAVNACNNLYGFIYFLFASFIIVGASNATNLTDGLDGLLIGSSVITTLSFLFIAHKEGNYHLEFFLVILLGALLGFLFFNFPKAKIFMGDTGSLALGALFAGIAIILHKELLFILFGGIFVVETLSVIMQVASFKLFKKRIFKMSPLHHHFELLGMKEISVVYLFWGIHIICNIIGVMLL